MIAQLFRSPVSSLSSRARLWSPSLALLLGVWMASMQFSPGWIGAGIGGPCSMDGAGLGVLAFRPSPQQTTWGLRVRRPSGPCRATAGRFPGEFPVLAPAPGDRLRSGWQSAGSGRVRHPGTADAYGHCRRRGLFHPLFGGRSSEEEDGGSGADTRGSDDARNRRKRSFSMKRIGGRQRRGRRLPEEASKPLPPTTTDSGDKRRFPGGFLISALLALTLLKNLLLGSGGGDAGYYYYSYSSSCSSVYETTIDPDGSRRTTETSRRVTSDLKSNIPGLTKDSIPGANQNLGIVIYDDGF